VAALSPVTSSRRDFTRKRLPMPGVHDRPLTQAGGRTPK
jgi:hypothetical protein